jgi:hypothetical protein
MRPSLLHTLGESRQRRRQRGRHGAELPGGPHAAARPAPAPAASRCAADADAERVREAGGPVDRAAYACACGYMFSAEVSTTVSCPHCGAGQAW